MVKLVSALFQNRFIVSSRVQLGNWGSTFPFQEYVVDY